jgi:hypothetical protein
MRNVCISTQVADILGQRKPGMCNDYGNYIDYADYVAAFSQTRAIALGLVQPPR